MRVRPPGRLIQNGTSSPSPAGCIHPAAGSLGSSTPNNGADSAFRKASIPQPARGPGAMLAMRDLIRERVRAGVAARIARGLTHGRPRRLDGHRAEVLRLKAEGRSLAGIARELGINRDSVRRLLAPGRPQP